MTLEPLGSFLCYIYSCQSYDRVASIVLDMQSFAYHPHSSLVFFVVFELQRDEDDGTACNV